MNNLHCLKSENGLIMGLLYFFMHTYLDYVRYCIARFFCGMQYYKAIQFAF